MRNHPFCAVALLAAFLVCTVGCSEDHTTPFDPVADGSGHVRTTVWIPIQDLQVTTDETCRQNLDDPIGFSGEVVLEEMRGELIFTNSPNFKHVHTEDIVVSEALVEQAYTLAFECMTPFDAVAFEGGVPALVDVVVTTGGCSNNPGPYITLSGEIRLGTTDAIVLLPEGESIKFNKQPPLDGAGGNPYLFFQLVDGQGAPISDMFFLGKCVQLSQP